MVVMNRKLRPSFAFLGALALTSASLGAQAEPRKDDDPLLGPDEMTSERAPESPGAAEKGARVLVLPYQPIYRSAGVDEVNQATEILVKELGRNFAVVRGGAAKEGASAPSGDALKKLVGDALALEKSKDVRGAIAAHRAAIEAMEKSPAGLESAASFIGEHHRLARLLLMTGENDGEADKVLAAAARMAPNYELDPTVFSRFYRTKFRTIAEAEVENGQAEVLVRSALPGARIYLDGRETAVAPVRLEKALPGKHLLQAEVEGVPMAAQVVTLKKGKNAEVTVSFGDTWGGIAVGAVADSIAENKLPKEAVAKAVSAGKEAEAKFVVAGGMAEDKVASKFNVHTFVVNVASGGVKVLDVINLDLDMLTAEADMFGLVQEVSKGVEDFGDAKNAVASIERKVRPQNIVNEVDAQPDYDAPMPTRGSARTEKRERRVFKALSGSTGIRIKDDEN